MIDSIYWQLNREQFKVKDMHIFDGVGTKQFTGYSGKTLFCKKYARDLKKQGVYFPMLEIATEKRGHELAPEVLNIQASLGKILYESNAFEPDGDDAPLIYEKTVKLLNTAGIEISPKESKQAVIRKADFSKVIILPDYLGLANQTILRLLSFNYKPSSKFDFVQYEEGQGCFIRFGNSTQRYSIYDKIGEIYAKGYTKTEKTIIREVELGETSRSALKFELGYLRKDSFEKAIKTRIKGKEKDYYLEDILKPELSKEILLKAFDTIFESVAVGLVSLSEMEENKLWAYLEKSGLSHTKQRDLSFWVRMATKNGIAGTWEEIGRKFKGGSVVRKKQEISLILQELGTISGNTPNLIDFLRAEHEKFEILKPQRRLCL
ncbi:MAG: hypothetical protein PHW73_03910 [Atribacterota bacterium]|nr:hypothetical protein [Atribacterota bacterium]